MVRFPPSVKLPLLPTVLVTVSVVPLVLVSALLVLMVKPDKLILIPGVIDPKSNIVEHPEVVAQRIETVVAAVGDRERVIAGVDCGFGTFVGWEWVTEDVMWAKLATLRAGADIASKRLWDRKAA